jgi:hypothetical protein
LDKKYTKQVLPEKLIVAQLVKFSTFYGTKVSVPCSQESGAAGPYPVPDESSQRPIIIWQPHVFNWMTVDEPLQ